MVEVLLVALGGAVGALVRHEATTRSSDPLRAVHIGNVVGAFLLGALASQVTGTALLVLGGGVLGGLTTFSTWMVLADGRHTGRHLLLPLLGGVLAAWAGTLSATAVFG